ncbi:inhibitor of apoptosis-promoting Bax1-domain-containing protein [Baffinella frigidus]|nr:inhibitor of apoptosis-promoting Bax1-domain-containing protein [Cryptophyta sp. CCMP2293]
MGTTTNVERPRNWKEAKDSGWQPPVYDSEEVKRQVQKGFLTKVYGILAIQLAVTTAFCVLFSTVESIQYAVVGNLWITLGLIFVLIPLVIGLVFLKNSYPWNMWLLAGFTVTMSVVVGTMCATYAMHGHADVLIMAAASTLFIFVSLTIFVHVSEIDFSVLGLILPICLLIFIPFMFVCIIFGFHWMWLVGAIGALLFSLFIVWDSYMIMNRMGCDDYPIACIELYLDIMNLFSFIMLLGGGGE